MLKVRALVISPVENMDMWIKFSNLCRKSGRIGLAEKSLNSLLPSNRTIDNVGTATVPPQVTYARLKFMWSTGSQQPAINHLLEFTDSLSNDLRTNMTNGMVQHSGGPHQTQMAPHVVENTRLLARCFLKQGAWQVSLHKNWQTDPAVAAKILDSYHKATQYHKDWYKAWHAWALANFEVVTAAGGNEPSDIPLTVIRDHVIPAIQGFFKSIDLSSGSSLQDTLRLLTLWFTHGGNSEVNSCVTEGFNTISVDTWLEVIPQLIARINQPDPVVRHTIHQLLAEVGRNHPQALVYPITVAAKSQLSRRKTSAVQIMDSVKSHSPKLVEQAEIVSQELIRVAVLWHELWHEGLEEASRLYFGDHNPDMMFKTLEPLHEMLERVCFLGGLFFSYGFVYTCIPC